MHEYALSSEIIRIVQETVKQQGLELTQLKKCIVTIIVGRMTTINPETLEFCLKLLGDEIAPEVVQPEIRLTPIEIYCKTCNISQTIHDIPLPVCLNCNSSDVEIRKGNELMVESIEIEQ